MQKKDFKPEGALTDVAAFNKLAVDNERLKQRVNILEKSFKDVQKEIFALQKCISSLLTTELQKDCTESMKQHCTAETVAPYMTDYCNRLPINEMSQSDEHFKCCGDTTKNRSRNRREAGRQTRPNKYRSSVAGCSNSRSEADDDCTNRKNVERPRRSHKHYFDYRIDKTTDNGSGYFSRHNDNTDKSSYGRCVDEKSRQPDFKYSKKRYVPEIYTSDHHDKHDRDERSGNAVRCCDHVDNFSLERRAGQSRHNLRSNEPPRSHFDKVSRMTNTQEVNKLNAAIEVQNVRLNKGHENHAADRNQRSCVIENGQQQNFKCSEEHNSYTTKKSTLDERDRKDDDSKRDYRLDQYSIRQLCDRSKHSTSSNNMVNSEKRNETLLPRGGDIVMTKSVPSQRTVKRPQLLNEVPATTNKRHKIVEDNETKEKSQYDVNGRISPSASKKTVGRTVEDVVPSQKFERSVNERRNETVELDVPPSNKITLWSDTGQMESTIGSEYLRKIYRTPMKLINEFTNYKMLSPLANTPNQPKDELNERKIVEISSVPFSLNIPSPNKATESSSDTKQAKSTPSEEIAQTLTKDEDRTQSLMEDSVKIQTITKTDEAEHGVFKRRRRKLLF